MARAIHSGQVQPIGAPAGTTSVSSTPTCSPTPCALSNVQASQGKKPVNEDPIAANPINAQDLLTGGNDCNCSSLLGFFRVGRRRLDVAVPPLLSGGVTEKPWLQVNDNASSPHAGALYLSVTQYDAGLSDTEISVSHSTNDGTSWTMTAVDQLQVFPSVDQFSDLAIGKDGTVYVSWLRCTANYPPGDCGGTQATLVLSKSTDGGSTWGTPVRVTPPGDPEDEFFPWLSVSTDGMVGVTWLDRRNDPTNLSYDAFAAISSDGGATFPNLQIASAASNPDNDGFKGTFMGDYTGNVWNSTGTTLYASWMDSRNGTNMQDEVGGRIGTGSVPDWNISASPNVGAGSNQLNGVAAISASDIWAVGFAYPSTSTGVSQTLTEQWNGTSWSVVPSLSDGTGQVGNDLLGVAAITTGNVWATGYEANSSSLDQTLIEQYCC